jgi:hypothetical protein
MPVPCRDSNRAPHEYELPCFRYASPFSLSNVLFQFSFITKSLIKSECWEVFCIWLQEVECLPSNPCCETKIMSLDRIGLSGVLLSRPKSIVAYICANFTPGSPIHLVSTHRLSWLLFGIEKTGQWWKKKWPPWLCSSVWNPLHNVHTSTQLFQTVQSCLPNFHA